MVENNLLNHALEAFKQVTGLPADVLGEGIRLPQGIADAKIRLADAKPMLAEVKKTLRPATLGVAMAQLQRFKQPGAIITDYITPQVADRLKEMGIPFLDTAGNVYLKTPKNFIYVTGRKKTTGIDTAG